jgi:hypothetical protein
MVRWRTGDSDGICEVSGSHSSCCSIRLARAVLSSGVAAKGEVRKSDVSKPVTDVFHWRLYCAWQLRVVRESYYYIFCCVVLCLVKSVRKFWLRLVIS